MDLTIVGLLFLAGVTIYFTNTTTKLQENLLIPWNEGVSKSRSLQAKGDASMRTELLRRRAIQSSGRLNTKKIKETRTQLGSITGAIETFMLSEVCPKIVFPSDILFDGGNATTEYCALDDSGNSGIVYDAGNENTRVCGV